MLKTLAIREELGDKGGGGEGPGSAGSRVRDNRGTTKPGGARVGPDKGSWEGVKARSRNRATGDAAG